ncbi:MAG: sensor histidine kinase, partial [Anaerolineales bacterium]
AAPGWYQHQVVRVGDGIAIMNRNITERKAAQQREFQLALEKERLNLLMTFVQNAAHEFRTPLSIIGTSAHLMVNSDDPARRQARAAKIADQINRMTRLVDMLLLMARIQGGDMLTQTHVNIRTLVQALCQRMTTVWGETPTLHCDLGMTVPPVWANEEYLGEAVWQVLDNAYIWTPPEGDIRLTLGADEASVWLTVTDSGPGIPPEHLPHIFDLFYRGDKAHSTPGLGLGLSIARAIIIHHGGTIKVHSPPEQGTTVTVRLPIP